MVLKQVPLAIEDYNRHKDAMLKANQTVKKTKDGKAMEEFYETQWEMGTLRSQNELKPSSTILENPANATLKVAIDNVMVQELNWAVVKAWHGMPGGVFHGIICGTYAATDENVGLTCDFLRAVMPRECDRDILSVIRPRVCSYVMFVNKSRPCSGKEE